MRGSPGGGGPGRDRRGSTHDGRLRAVAPSLPRPRSGRRAICLAALALAASGAACASTPPRAAPSPRLAPRRTPPQTRSGLGVDGGCVGLVVETTTRGETRVETWSRDDDADALEHAALTWSATLEPEAFVLLARVGDAEIRVAGVRGDDTIALTHESPLGRFTRAVPYGPGTALDLGPAAAWLPIAHGLRARLGAAATTDVRALRLVGAARAPRVELATIVARSSSAALDVVVRRAERGGDGDEPDRVGLRLDGDGHVLALGPPRVALTPGLASCPRPPALPHAAEVQAAVRAALAAHDDRPAAGRTGSGRPGSARPATRGPQGPGRAPSPGSPPAPGADPTPEPADPP
jgi:hypothetical protein